MRYRSPVSSKAMDPDLRKFNRNLSNARRELRKAVERGSDTELRHGHYKEAARLAQACVDAATALIVALESKEPP